MNFSVSFGLSIDSTLLMLHSFKDLSINTSHTQFRVKMKKLWPQQVEEEKHANRQKLCRDISRLCHKARNKVRNVVATNPNYVVTKIEDKLCCNKVYYVMTKPKTNFFAIKFFLSQQRFFCCNKDFMLQQRFLYRDKDFSVATKISISQQSFSITIEIFLSQQSFSLSQQNFSDATKFFFVATEFFCRNKVFLCHNKIFLLQRSFTMLRHCAQPSEC